MSDAIAAFGAARDALNANIFGGQVGDDSSAFQRSLETFINSVAAAAEAAASDAESLDEVSSDHRVPRAARRLRRLGASAF